MEVTVINLQKKIPLNSLSLKKVVKKTLKLNQVNKASLSFVFVTAQKIRSLNKKYLNKNTFTDVLAFGYNETKNDLKGDIIISTDAVIQNAKTYKNDTKRELVLYIIHGILHLIGYDDHASRDIKRMRAKENEILDSLGINIDKIVA